MKGVVPLRIEIGSRDVVSKRHIPAKPGRFLEYRYLLLKKSWWGSNYPFWIRLRLFVIATAQVFNISWLAGGHPVLDSIALQLEANEEMWPGVSKLMDWHEHPQWNRR